MSSARQAPDGRYPQGQYPQVQNSQFPQYFDDCGPDRSNLTPDVPYPQSGGMNGQIPDTRYQSDRLSDGRRQNGDQSYFDPKCLNRGSAGQGYVSYGRGPGQVLRPFGYDLFSSQASTFAPATNIPIPADYVLGPGDNVKVQLFGNQNANYNLSVSRDGRINFPKLGPIDVAGQRFDDVRSMLEDRVAREMIGVQASISLGELRSMQVFLLGDVNQPGSYTVSSLSTITNALIVGGGVSLVGSLRNVQLKRSGQTVVALDLYDLLLRGDSSRDQRLLPGDVIFVPPVGPRVSVDGEVRRPAIYELRGESSVSEVLKLAGGLMASTSTSTVQITRYDRNQKKILMQIDAAKPSDLASRVQDGDLIRIRKVAGPLDNNVRILGFVRYPGAYEWSAGYNLAQLLQAAQVLPSETGKETYLPLGLIERTNTDSGVRGWVSFNVRDALTGTNPIVLQQDDLVVILNRKDVDYLDSSPVRAVAQGDFRQIRSCPGLQELAGMINSERSVRFLKAFSAEATRDDASRNRSALDGQQQGSQPLNGGQSSSNDQSSQDKKSTQEQQLSARDRLGAQVAVPCPDIFVQVPRALPYLLEESVAVYGEVRNPGLYPIAPNTPLNLLVEAAGGLSHESDSSDIEYVSYEEALKNGRSSYQKLDLVQSGGLSINPGDVFNFRPLYLGQEVGTVKAAGEFRFPASYGILRGERLSGLMSRAGGITESAYPYGAVFTRASARRAEQESYHRAASDLQEAMVTAVTSGALGTNAQISSQFLSTVVQRLESAQAVGRVVIEADPAVLKVHPEMDPILEPGDAIFMPKRPISVTVIGQVLNPGTLEYMPGLSTRQYIDRAGGYTQASDSGRVFVILPNGTAQKIRASFWSSESRNIPPGSIIVVPRDAAPFNTMAFSERIFGVLSNLALTAAALATISRN